MLQLCCYLLRFEQPNWLNWTELNELNCRVCKNVGAWRSLRREGSEADFVVICWNMNSWTKTLSLGGPRAMCRVALCCSDVKYVAIVLLFATIWTTELNWTELTDWTDRVCKNVGAWRSLLGGSSDADFIVICLHMNNWTKTLSLGGPRAMSRVALCCSDVKYVAIVLLFATIWTTELNWTDWTERFVKMLARGVPFVGKDRKQMLWLNWKGL
jgi:hypothetical protein